MRKFFKRLGWVLAVLALLAAVAGFVKRDELARLWAVNRLFDEDRIVWNFSHMDRLFFTRAMGAGTPEPLPEGPAARLPLGFDDWQQARSVTATVVLHGGRVVHENYRLGTGAEDLRISWSMAKSALSLLFGTLVDDGTFTDLDVPVTRYAPSLRGSAYDGATIRNVLNMASGVSFDEDYLDFWSDINRMGRVLALGGSMDAFAAGQSARRGAPGADWLYVSIDTHVIAMVIRGATGRSIPDLMQERLFAPLHLEHAPYFITDGEGVAFALGGLNLTTRDFARLGQLVAQGGQWNGAQIVSRDWIEASTGASAPQGAGYGYQWWVPDHATGGEVYAIGIYGQYIWIDPARDVVVAVNSADRLFEEPGATEENIAMLRAIAQTVSSQPME